jgi:uncharacterized ParB-like nuclease family protein
MTLKESERGRPHEIALTGCEFLSTFQVAVDGLILEVGQTTPIQVRRDGKRFVLVEGLHRLEACRALGEETIIGYLVQTPKH